MDRIRATLEAQQSEMQAARGEFERKSKQPQDTIQVRAHRKAGKIDLGRRASKEYQEMRERADISYVEPKTRAKGTAQQRAHQARTPKAKPESSWIFEGTYATKAEADAVRRNYKRNGYFVMVKRMGQGGYSLWIKPIGKVSDKRLKGIKGGKERKGIVTQGVEIAGRTGANLTSLGSLPEYKPPDFKLAKSGYKPLDYKPVEAKSGYTPLTYKPVSAEPMFKSFQPYKPVTNEPYYKKSEYVPIGEFGVKGAWAKKRKRKKVKAKRARLVGVK